jgi:hypothetical protein
MFFGHLCVHIGPYRFQRSAANTANKVGTVSTQRLAVELGYVFGKTTPGAPCAGRFLVVVDILPALKSEDSYGATHEKPHA